MLPFSTAMPAAKIAYRAALELLESTLPEKHRLLLVRHYEAPKRIITARQLAAKVGYPSYGTVNLQYGTLARRVCEILGQRHRFHVLALATFLPGTPESDGELRWVMKPEVARALEELGWV